MTNSGKALAGVYLLLFLVFVGELLWMTILIDDAKRAIGTVPCYATVVDLTPPHHRDGSHDYWQGWCSSKWGQPIDKNRRQDALDWADHCTEVGDAK